MKRVLGWVSGVLLALVMTFWCVTATADLALSAGIYGTPGTYKVEDCYDTDDSRKNSDYACHGDFTPDGGTADDAVYVRLTDTGHDYPDGSTFDARQGIEPDTIQRAGFWGVVGELWQVAISIAVLAVLAYQAIKPHGEAAQRREAHRREPSRRQKVADGFGSVVVIAGAVAILSWIAMLVEPRP
ncbi:hypothetical protein ACIBU0_18110 [Streptomyces sp. NPDC049627]|uniref:hypothetical protein n=1 Tax=Streptomyces sp. NPDC049627 TaxID=3365595 RepID=UPI003788278D